MYVLSRRKNDNSGNEFAVESIGALVSFLEWAHNLTAQKLLLYVKPVSMFPAAWPGIEQISQIG